MSTVFEIGGRLAVPFLKTVEKYWLVVKPHSMAMSVIVFCGSSRIKVSARRVARR